MRGHSKVAVAVLVSVCAVPMVRPAHAQGHMRPSLGAGAYFPLRVGNVWTYQRVGAGAPTEWTVEVNGKPAPLAGRHYFTLSGYFPGPGHDVRADPFGVVTERNPGFPRDYLWYVLGAPEGTSWEIELAPSPLASPLRDCVSGARLTLAARGETVSVPAGTFPRVIRVDWVSPCVDAGLTSEWFAPGVGLIRRQETSIAGPVVSELVRAELGETVLPRLGYTTSVTLDRPLYYNNLMPPIGPESTPAVAGAFAVHNRTDLPITFTFSGCKSVAIQVVNDSGETVLTAGGDDGGCCSCDHLLAVELVRGGLSVPFSFELATPAGEPLPDGRYAVRVVLETLGGEAVRPSASAAVEVKSAH